jgi:hypothetical protein
MQIGDIIEHEEVEWTVTRVSPYGHPLCMRTNGRQPGIHLGSIITVLDTVVKSKSFIDGITQIELLPPAPRISLM